MFPTGMLDWLTDTGNTFGWDDVPPLLLLLVVSWLLSRIFLFASGRLADFWTRKGSRGVDLRVLEAGRKSIARLIQLLGVYLAVHRYRFGLLRVIDSTLFVIAVALLTHMLTRMTAAALDAYGEKLQRRRKDTSLNKDLLPLTTTLARVLLFLVGLMVILDHFHIEMRSILVTLGVGSLAIGLALQDTLANMFAGFILLLDQNIGVGDRVLLESGELGDIEQIGLRSTRLLKADGHILIVPNAVLMRTRVTNLSLPDPGATLHVEFRVSQDADAETAKRIMREAAAGEPLVLQAPPPRAFIRSVADTGMTLLLVCRIRHHAEQIPATDALNAALISRFRAAGIRFQPQAHTVFVAPAAGVPGAGDGG